MPFPVDPPPLTPEQEISQLRAQVAGLQADVDQAALAYRDLRNRFVTFANAIRAEVAEPGAVTKPEIKHDLEQIADIV